MWCMNCGNIHTAYTAVSPERVTGRGSYRCNRCNLVIGDFVFVGPQLVVTNYYSKQDFEYEGVKAPKHFVHARKRKEPGP